jgi:hypothetical protein
MFVSRYLTGELESQFDLSGPQQRNRFLLSGRAPLQQLVGLMRRRMPEQLFEDGRSLFPKILRSGSFGGPVETELLKRYVSDYPASDEMTTALAEGLRTGRLEDLGPEFDWSKGWACNVDAPVAEMIMSTFGRELTYHQNGNFDQDLERVVDLVARLAEGQITDSDDIQAQAKELRAEAEKLYPSIGTYVPDPEGPPATSEVWNEMTRLFEERSTQAGGAD